MTSSDTPSTSSGKTSGNNAVAVTGTQATLGQTFGEMVWLLTQSPVHKQLKIADIEWLLMPAIVLGQARVFKAGKQALGMAFWAYLTPEQAEKMGKEGRLDAAGWRHGTDIMQVMAAEQAGQPLDLTPPKVKDGELELWLVDFVCPFATTENKLAEACMHDLITGPLKGQKLKMHKLDPKTAERTVVELGGE